MRTCSAIPAQRNAWRQAARRSTRRQHARAALDLAMLRTACLGPLAPGHCRPSAHLDCLDNAGRLVLVLNVHGHLQQAKAGENAGQMHPHRRQGAGGHGEPCRRRHSKRILTTRFQLGYWRCTDCPCSGTSCAAPHCMQARPKAVPLDPHPGSTLSVSSCAITSSSTTTSPAVRHGNELSNEMHASCSCAPSCTHVTGGQKLAHRHQLPPNVQRDACRQDVPRLPCRRRQDAPKPRATANQLLRAAAGAHLAA